MNDLRRSCSAIRYAWVLVVAASSALACIKDAGDPFTPDSGVDNGGDATPIDETGDAVPGDGGDDAQALIDAGKIVFLTAGGKGCASCHGPKAEGISGNGPNIRGKTEPQIIEALTTVKAMQFLKYPTGVTPTDVHAVAAYLAWLATQPP